MLERNRFLYKQDKGNDSMGWSGMWRAPMVLQTFAHHLNYLHGRAEVPAFEGELHSPRTALALVSTVLCHILTLVSENLVTFEISEGKNSEVWTAVVPKGNQYEFNDTIWGTATRRYLDPIQSIPAKHFTVIVEETQEHVKKTMLSSITAGSSGDAGDDSELEELFAYCLSSIY
ncbi:hypothetical protein JVT61DRAFT_3779 [Boletus reticuloceps]|uniref:Uncharacterized protein n=1 Tax=Boletus reticuloceps TaxID=495285 RepID=A0A8I2YP10_9AGAM|nr:hypothetical protein JVT61DRAFT_3779 [Boletus reticuloceps]